MTSDYQSIYDVPLRAIALMGDVVDMVLKKPDEIWAYFDTIGVKTCGDVVRLADEAGEDDKKRHGIQILKGGTVNVESELPKVFSNFFVGNVFVASAQVLPHGHPHREHVMGFCVFEGCVTPKDKNDAFDGANSDSMRVSFINNRQAILNVPSLQNGGWSQYIPKDVPILN